MKIQHAIRQYLANSDQTARGLALRAGLGPKAVYDILNVPGIRPRHATLARLSTETGLDLHSFAEFSARTWADLLRELETRAADEHDAARTRRQIARVKWLLRATGWVCQTRRVCRAEVLEFLGASKAATFKLSPGSFANYKAEILSAISDGGVRERRRSVVDIGGVWADVHALIVASDSDLKDDFKFIAGSFLVFLHDAGIKPSDVTGDTLAAYYAHRLETSAKSEAVCRKHVKRIANLVSALSSDVRFAAFGFAAVKHPFGDKRDRFGVSDADIAPLMKQWDDQVTPWAMGRASRDGQTREKFIETLDELDQQTSDKKARLRKKRAARGVSGERKAGASERDELLRRHGFLTGTSRWNEKTARIRRGYVSALAKSFRATTGETIEDLDELTDPEILEEAVDALSSANEGEFDSDYVASVLITLLKVAAGMICRDDADIKAINDLIAQAKTGRSGIAPRNKSKLRQFTDDRIQGLIDLSDTLLRGINNEIDARRKAHRRVHGALPQRAEVVDRELSRDVMTALAHAIMLKRGPRSENLIGIRLDWISWREDVATIVVPATEVKLRGKGDPDLPIPLGVSASKLLRSYLGSIRAKALLPGDKDNPFLFPGQDTRNFRSGRPYTGILERLTRRVHEIVGVKIHPHLYRHLIGWIWLREDIDNLPQVQKLLGHKSMQTTIDHYAEIDENLALDKWQEFLDSHLSL